MQTATIDPRSGTGSGELAAALRGNRGLVASVALFSVAVNMLMLTGPIFMLQVYDRVLTSGSVETLAALFALVVFLFLAMGLLDLARARVMARVGARLRLMLEPRIFAAELGRTAASPTPRDDPQAGGLDDLDAVQRLCGAPVLLALFDLPGTPLFLAGLFVFHPWLGWLALAGGAALVAMALLNQALTRGPARVAQAASAAADRLGAELRAETEAVQALGMLGACFLRWRRRRAAALEAAARAADRAGGFAVATRTLRLFLQSAVLALGAWLVLRGELGAGAMIAASILLARALAPVETAVGQWDIVRRGVAGWRALAHLLSQVPEAGPRTALPRPEARVEVDTLSLVPPGQAAAALRMVSFTLAPGQVLGVIGASGAGKSSLARALTGLWPPASGQVLLGGVPGGQYGPAALGRLIGYLPQRAALFEGTVAENIARFDPDATDAAVVEAARRAGAHAMIAALPDGYDTRLGPGGVQLAGGHLQRLGLARALYCDPVLLLLDEPDASLDAEGVAALSAAIRRARAEGRAVIVMAHRPAAIGDCDLLLVLEAGRRRAFGPRDRILRETVANHADLQRRAAPGGAA